MRRTAGWYYEKKKTVITPAAKNDAAAAGNTNGRWGGGYIRSWEDVAELWAEIVPVSSRERLAAMQHQSELTRQLTICARPGVNASQRLLAGERSFYIRSVAPIEKGQLLEMLVEERAGI